MKIAPTPDLLHQTKLYASKKREQLPMGPVNYVLKHDKLIITSKKNTPK